MIRFLLNDETIELGQTKADLTVLDFLRDHCGKRGTKEGCASGDCGACTVVVAQKLGHENNELMYQNINSCVTFVGSLHGKQLITVEHLAKDDELHQVQQAMVDCHGSQCGFCTPGFVMSLFALQKTVQRDTNQSAVDRSCDPQDADSSPTLGATEKINEYLGGNLCRCTGYRPISEAAKQIMQYPKKDQFDEQTAEVIAALSNLTTQNPQPQSSKADIVEALGPGSANFHIPESLGQLHALIARYPSAKLLAGGTDLALEVTQKMQTIPQIILLSGIKTLTRIIDHTHNIEIGAATSLSHCATGLATSFPEITRLLHRFGSRQVRNQGTIGGNIANASPIGDMPPVLIALRSKLTLQRKNRSNIETRVINVEDYFIDYKITSLQSAEFIQSIHIPKPDPTDSGAFFRVYKVSKRIDDDISAVCGAFNLHLTNGVIDDVCIAFGGMAAIPKRAPNCEQSLMGKPLTRDTVDSAKIALLDDFEPITDARASAEYRQLVAQNLLTRLQIELTTPDVLTNVTDFH